MRRYIVHTAAFLFGTILYCGGASAQSDAAAVAPGGGGEAMGFVKIARDPVAAAMGFTSATSSSLAWAYASNPAAIVFSDSDLDFQLGWQGWAPSGVKSNNIVLGGGYRFGDNFGISLGLVHQSGQSYEVLNESNFSKGSFTPSDMHVGLGMGLRIADFLSAGVNVAFLRQALSTEHSSTAFGADVFLMGSFGDFKAVIGVSDIGTDVKSYSGSSLKLPASVTAGAGYSKAFAKVHSVRVNLDADYYFFASQFGAGLGAEYGWKNMVFVRAGYHFGTGYAVLPSFATAGLGARLGRFSLNAAYITANTILGNTIMVTAGYSF